MVLLSLGSPNHHVLSVSFSPMTAKEGIELREKAILLGEKKCSKEDPHVF